jgi:hypothetical protein
VPVCLITKEGESLSFRIEKTRALGLRSSIVGWSGPCDRFASTAERVDAVSQGQPSKIEVRV